MATQTKQQTQRQAAPQQSPQQSRELSKAEKKELYKTQLAEPRIPFPEKECEALGISRGDWIISIDSIWPGARSINGVLLAWRYCRSRKLDPFKRTVHIVPIYNSALGYEVESVWPGIAELRTTAHRTRDYAGNDDCVFGPMIKHEFKAKVTEQRDGQDFEVEKTTTLEFPAWAQMTVYRMVQGQRVPFVGPKVKWLHAYGRTSRFNITPNEMWTRRPDEQLEKCAEAAALRRAFPEEMGGEISAEEMAGQHVIDLGGGVSIETPSAQQGGQAQAKARPDRAGFTDGQPKDVNADGSVDESESQEDDSESGLDVVDEVGEVKETIDPAEPAKYYRAVADLMEAATEEKALRTIWANNGSNLRAGPENMWVAIGKTYDKLLAKLKKANGGAAGGDKAEGDGKSAAPEQGEQPKPGLTLVNHMGKPVKEGLQIWQFAIEICKLFEGVDMKVDLENLRKKNEAVINGFEDDVKNTITYEYDQAMLKFTGK